MPPQCEQLATSSRFPHLCRSVPAGRYQLSTVWRPRGSINGSMVTGYGERILPRMRCPYSRRTIRTGGRQTFTIWRPCDWIQAAKQSGIGSLVRFAFGLQKDLPAVLAAVETAWSNGQVEGQINRLKTIKRQMYGPSRLRFIAGESPSPQVNCRLYVSASTLSCTKLAEEPTSNYRNHAVRIWLTLSGYRQHINGKHLIFRCQRILLQ